MKGKLKIENEEGKMCGEKEKKMREKEMERRLWLRQNRRKEKKWRIRKKESV